MPETMGQKWKRTAKVEVVISQMRHKFGQFPAEIETTIMSGNEEQLNKWILRVLTATTPDDVLDTRR
jgi:hypothetical protein